MTVKKDPKRQLLGKIAKARGKQFESRIDDSFAYYAQKGFAIIEKTPEPMHPTKNLGNGKFIAYYEKQAQPDYKGTIKGGRTVMFEAKFTAADRMEQSRVLQSQQDYMDRHQALGEEPGWVAEQRKKDFEAYAIQRKDPWGEDEDSRLKMLLSKHRYSWAEISEMMHRSHGAIARRCRDLGIKDRPVSMELTGKRGTWTSEDFEILADGIRHGDSYAAIGKAVGRSEKCVRSKVYNDYLTENADKVREMLGDGAWGHGAPEMDVRHGFYISRTRHQVRRDLSALATVLRKRMNNLGYDPYWQRFMCMNWDDIGGCSAGCTDCDSCTAFRRIQPQYCARCGGTFYERKENRFCAACRTARKKQAQRHWCRVNGMSRK